MKSAWLKKPKALGEYQRNEESEEKLSYNGIAMKRKKKEK